jgi:hypothetical protein
MTTVAPDTDKLKALEEDRARAWRAYQERLAELTGEAYELAERDSWKVLQNELRRLERRRSLLAVPSADRA